MGEFFVYSFFLSALFTVLPVFIRTEGFLDVRENRLYFSVGPYESFSVFGGYAQLVKGGIAVHISRKKAIYIPFEKMTDTRKKFEITKGFQLYRLHQTIETGNVRTPASVLFATLLQSVSGQVFSVLQTNHPFLSLKNSILISEETTFKATFQVVTVFNGLVLLSAIAKKSLEVIIAWNRKRKLIALWKKRRNSLQIS